MVAFHDSLANCQANSRARNVFAVKSLEDAKNLFMMLRGNPDAIVGDRETPLAIRSLGGDPNPKWTFRPVLDGVADEILKELDEMRPVPAHNGQGIAGDYRSTLLDRGLQALVHFLKNLIEVERAGFLDYFEQDVNSVFCKNNQFIDDGATDRKSVV